MSIVQYPYDVKTLKGYDGCEIAYVDIGGGDVTILFIHGLATYCMSWEKNIEGLSNKFRCIAIDLPGNGLSGNGDYSYDIPFFAKTIIDFIGRLQLKNVCLAGHSMGGQIAMAAALEAPQCAEKLILCAPAGFETFTEIEKTVYQNAIVFSDIFSSDEHNLRKTIHSSFYHTASQADGMIRELILLQKNYPAHGYKKMIERCIKGMLQYSVFDKLQLIQQPTFVLFGERDALIPNRLLHPVTTKQIAMSGVKKMPYAELKMIPQCGHFLQIEKATEVNKIISNWLMPD